MPSRPSLLFGPYQSPRLRVGDRTFCLYRDCEVVITSWTDAPISWPRCQVIGQRGGSGLLLDAELSRAVRHESAVAVCFLWGVTEGVVCRWRKLLGVTRTNNEGTHQLVQAAAELGAAAIQEREFSDEERLAQAQRSRALNLEQYLHKGFHGPWWTPEEIALLGTMPDWQVAQKVGRTWNAVRLKREKLDIPNPETSDGR